MPDQVKDLAVMGFATSRSKSRRVFMVLSMILMFVSQQLIGQQNVLKKASLLYIDSQMDSSALLFQTAYDYFLKENKQDSAALALAGKAAPVMLSKDLVSGARLIDQSLNLYATHDYRSYDIEIGIYGEAVRVYSAMGKADTTEYFLNKIKSIIDEFPDSVSKKTIAMFYWNLSYTQYLKGNIPSALQTAGMAKSLFLDLFGPTSPQVAAVFDWLGTLHRDVSQYEQAIDFAKQSIVIAELDTQLTYNLAVSYNNLAGLYNNVGDYKNALVYNDRALGFGEILVNSGQIDKSYLYTFHSTRSRTYGGLKKINESLLELKKAESDISENSDFMATYLYSNMKQAYVDLSDLDMAKVYMEKTWSYFRGVGSENMDDYSHFLGLDGSLDYMLGDFNASLKKLKRAAWIRDSIFEEPEYYLAATYEDIGLTYCSLDSVEQASRAFQMADTIGRQLFSKGHESILSFNINHAECLFRHGQKIEAERLLKKLIEEIGINTKDFKVDNWSTVTMQPTVLELLSAHVKIQIDKLNEAPSIEQKKYLIKAVNNYIEYVERYIGYFDSFSSHLNIGDDYFKSLGQVIAALDDHGNTKSDNEFIYKCIQKSKTLISRMVLNDVTMDHFSGVPDSIVEQELLLRSKLNMTANQLMEKSFKPATDDDPFLSLERKYRQLQQNIRDHYPSYYELKYDFSVPMLSEIQNALPTGSVFLDYFISDSFALVVAITSRSYTLHRLSTDLLSLQNRVDTFNHLISDISSDNWKVFARELYTDLVRPMKLDMADFDQIIVCPDGPMYELAMELCLEDEVIAPRPLMYVISARDAIRGEHYDTNNELRVLGFAPSFTHLKKSSVLPQPFSRSLAKEIQSQFEAEIYFDQDASESTFKSRLSDYPILHISTHGILDENDPLSSYLLFYEDSLNDGHLTLNELYGLRLKSNLALLNACSTSKGKFRKGAGMNSLASGFQFAGCNNLITSLWSVDEQANTQILQNLYKRLKAGDSPTMALYQAKKLFLESAPAELKHPYYWAGVSLIGVGEAMASTGFSFLYRMILGSLALIFLVILIRYMRKRFDK